MLVSEMYYYYYYYYYYISETNILISTGSICIKFEAYSKIDFYCAMFVFV